MNVVNTVAIVFSGADLRYVPDVPERSQNFLEKKQTRDLAVLRNGSRSP